MILKTILKDSQAMNNDAPCESDVSDVLIKTKHMNWFNGQVPVQVHCVCVHSPVISTHTCSGGGPFGDSFPWISTQTGVCVLLKQNPVCNWILINPDLCLFFQEFVFSRKHTYGLKKHKSRRQILTNCLVTMTLWQDNQMCLYLDRGNQLNPITCYHPEPFSFFQEELDSIEQIQDLLRSFSCSSILLHSETNLEQGTISSGTFPEGVIQRD